jgi:hypothetical protein
MANGQTLMPAVLKTKIAFKAGEEIHASGYLIKSSRSVKTGESICVLSVGSALVSIGADVRKAKSDSNLNPWFAAFKEGTNPKDRASAVEAWRVERIYLGIDKDHLFAEQKATEKLAETQSKTIVNLIKEGNTTGAKNVVDSIQDENMKTLVREKVRIALANSSEEVRQNPFANPPKNWPKASGVLDGDMEVRVTNPNDFQVRVGLRASGKGKDFVVSPNDSETVRVPNGQYDIYFNYSSDPEGLYRGDSFTLNDNGVEIQIVKVVNGNYGIRKVK